MLTNRNDMVAAVAATELNALSVLVFYGCAAREAMQAYHPTACRAIDVAVNAKRSTMLLVDVRHVGQYVFDRVQTIVVLDMTYGEFGQHQEVKPSATGHDGVNFRDWLDEQGYELIEVGKK